MTLLLVVVAIAIVAGVAVLVARGEPVLVEDPVEARALTWPPEGGVSAQGLASARFTVALRGYRMDEVDRVLDDARAALLERDARIADLERVVGFLAPAAQSPATESLATEPATSEPAARDLATTEPSTDLAAPEPLAPEPLAPEPPAEPPAGEQP